MHVIKKEEVYREIDLFCPQIQTVPLSSELTIFAPSGLMIWNKIQDICYYFKIELNLIFLLYLNIQHRIASPFSCDKMLVLLPSVKSHKTMVPSTDAEASTPPYTKPKKNTIIYLIQFLISNVRAYLIRNFTARASIIHVR